jgi:hypothetical protein
MSVDKINISQEITWKALIDDSEAQIKTRHDEIDELRKSITFFRKQERAGIPFPLNGNEKAKRHENNS